MSEERVVGAVSADEVRGHVERITTTIPSRLAGSENGRRMAEYSAAALTEAGVAARVFEMAGLVSFPEPAEMRVVAPVEIAIEANTLGHNGATPAAGGFGAGIVGGPGAFQQFDGR